MAERPPQTHDGASLIGWGTGVLGLGVLMLAVWLLRTAFPDGPWHVFRTHKPPLAPWQKGIVVALVHLVGLHMIYSGVRARRAHRARRRDDSVEPS